MNGGFSVGILHVQIWFLVWSIKQQSDNVGVILDDCVHQYCTALAVLGVKQSTAVQTELDLCKYKYD